MKCLVICLSKSVMSRLTDLQKGQKWTTLSYGNTGYRFSSPGMQNWKDFCLKINIHKGNCWILRIGIVGGVKKCKNSYFKVNFLSKKSSQSFSFFFIWRIHFLKWCPIFDSSPLHRFAIFNNLLWLCWFLGKNLTNFVSPSWKLDSPYYHTTQSGENFNLHNGANMLHFYPDDFTSYFQRIILSMIKFMFFYKCRSFFYRVP